MSVRLQTRFPYGIQIAPNGREWLRRSLEKLKIDFIIHGIKFLPLRKGVADIAIRARIAGNVNNRFMDQMAAVKDVQPFRQILAPHMRSRSHLQNVQPAPLSSRFLRADLDHRTQCTPGRIHATARQSRRLGGQVHARGALWREMIRVAHFASRASGIRKNPAKSGAPRLAGQGCGCAARHAILAYP